MKQKVIFILLSVILIGCQSEGRKTATGDLPVIDFSKNYPVKEIRMQDIADIEYIPLETTDDVLLGRNASLTYVSDQYILINDGYSVFVFNRTGKILSYFNRRGQGPQEYTTTFNIIFDEKNEEVFICNYHISQILVYSIYGEYKRTLKYDNTTLFLPYIYHFDDETMLVYTDYESFRDNNPEKPYKLMSKRDGSIVSEINIRLPVRYETSVYRTNIVEGQQYTSESRFLVSINMPYIPPDCVIADISSDTIYRLTPNRELIPMLVRTPSVHSSDPPVVWSVPLVADKFILVHRTTFDRYALEQSGRVPMNILMYEFETGQTSQVSFVDDNLGRIGMYTIQRETRFSKNTYARLCQPNTIIDYYDAKRSKGEKVEITDEEDNPIVAIYTFK